MPFMIHLATKEAVVSASVMLHKFLNAGPQLLKWLQRVSGTAIYHPDNYAECGHSRGQRRREIAADRKRARPIAFAPPPQCESDNKADWQEGKRRLIFVMATLPIIGTYPLLSHTSDEPAHPPSARLAVALGPYLLGVRSYGADNIGDEGLAILYTSGDCGL